MQNINISEVLGREENYYTEEAKKEFSLTYKMILEFTNKLNEEEKNLLLDIANHNYNELIFLIIHALENK